MSKFDYWKPFGNVKIGETFIADIGSRQVQFVKVMKDNDPMGSPYNALDYKNRGFYFSDNEWVLTQGE